MVDGQSLSWFSDPRKWFRALLMLDDSSHRIALGAAIGMFIALTPTVGIQMLIVLALALLTGRLFRFNKMAALLMVYVSNPLTVVPIYWFSYKLGTVYFPSDISHERFESILQYNGLSEWWLSFTRLFVEVGLPLVVGSLVIATCAAMTTYPLILRVVRNMRRAERQAIREAKAVKRREKAEKKAATKELSAETQVTVVERVNETSSVVESSATSRGRSDVGVEQRARVS